MKKILYSMATVLLLIAATAYGLITSSVDKPVLFGQMSEVSKSFEDHRRSYSLYTPVTVSDPNTLVFVLHGSIGNGEKIRERTQFGFDLLADQHGFRVVYPNGFENHWNDCRTSAEYEANKQNINDVGFLQSIATDLSIDKQTPSNIFVTGFSNGGHLAFRLAQEHPDWVSAIAAIAANMPTKDNNSCEQQDETVPAMIMNGTDDPINPYQGGKVSLFGLGDRGKAMSTKDSLSHLAKQPNALKALPPEDTRTIGNVSIEHWIVNDRPFQAVTINRGGHTIPGSHGTMPRLLGQTNHDIEASSVIWEFFAQAKKS